MSVRARWLWLAVALLGVGACAVACEGPPTEVAYPARVVDNQVTAAGALPPRVIEPMKGFSWVVEGSLAGMPRPGALRPIDEDVAFLAASGIALLVSLTETPTDRTALAAHGIELLHIPVLDFTAPTQDQLREYAVTVRSWLADGQAVAVHCGAGKGRTGTFLAAYFVTEGMTADAAIRHVRALRPGSIETAAQEAAVAEFYRVIHSSVGVSAAVPSKAE
jgi:atypical dual specificity phosphatase